MAGCRALTAEELERLTAPETFTGRYAQRDRALFVLGLYSGFRINELLSLRVRDVLHDGRFVARLRVERRHMKRKRTSREIVLHPEARKALRPWLEELFAGGHAAREVHVFRSQKGRDEAISVPQAWRIIVGAFTRCGLVGKLATHSMRKTYACGVYRKALERLRAGEAVDPSRAAMHCLGHADVATTERYLDFDAQIADELTLAL